MTTPSSPAQSRAAVAIAIGLLVLGVAAVASGVVMLLSAPNDEPASTVAVTAVATTTTGSSTSSTVAPASTITSSPPEGGFGTEASLTLVDDSGVLSLSVPVTWIDFETDAWMSDGQEIGPSVAAAPDHDAWVEGWATPGIFVGATDQMEFDDAFGDFSGVCLLDHTSPLEVDGLTGSGEWWTDCGVERSEFFVGVVTLEDGASVILFQVVAVDGDIDDLVDRLLSTFRHGKSR